MENWDNQFGVRSNCFFVRLPSCFGCRQDLSSMLRQKKKKSIKCVILLIVKIRPHIISCVGKNCVNFRLHLEFSLKIIIKKWSSFCKLKIFHHQWRKSIRLTKSQPPATFSAIARSLHTYIALNRKHQVILGIKRIKQKFYNSFP